MRIVSSLEQFGTTDQPVVLTIGNFDGIHLGHQYVLNQVRKTAQQTGAISAVLTFSNPPSTILYPDRPIQQLCSLEQKMTLLDQMGMDCVVLLEFTKEFSEQNPQEFLDKICQSISLSHLILGHDSRIGKDRQGDEKTVNEYGSSHDIAVEYLDKFLVEGSPVSSSKIRPLIQEGRLEEAAKLLGRQYSLMLHARSGKGLGKTIGYSTLNFDIHHFCLPPIGVYSVRLKIGDKMYDAIANLGYAPTVRHESFPQLEVHVLNEMPKHDDQLFEVIFHQWIREEKKFESLEALRKQISQDIEVAKQQLQS